MIRALKPYAEVKDSGVPWLGQVPAHWEVRRIKYLLSERDSRSLAGTEQLLRVSQYTGVTERKRTDELDGPDTRAASLVGYKRVSPLDLVVNIMLAWNGSMGVSPFEGICSPAYCVYRFGPDAIPMYFHHLLRSPAYRARIKALSRGVVDSRLRLYTNDLFRLEALLPPKDEQAAIVRFLDHADRRIRRAIAAKQKLIKLLEEQEQVIIHRAVTRGLDLDARLISSGVEWLGDLPTHWDTIRAGSLFRLFGGFAFPGAGFIRDGAESELPLVLTPLNFDPDGGLRFSAINSVRFQGAYPEKFRLKQGDLVTVLTDLSRKRLILGRAGFVRHEGVLLNQRTARIDIHKSMMDKVHPSYLCWTLNSWPVRSQTIATSRGSTVFHTSPSRMLAASMPLPPMHEQIEIANFLDRVNQELRIMRSTAEDQIGCLREYRTRLIADVVTGKLDVREAAARLPEASESELPYNEALDAADDEAALDEAIAEDEAV